MNIQKLGIVLGSICFPIIFKFHLKSNTLKQHFIHYANSWRFLLQILQSVVKGLTLDIPRFSQRRIVNERGFSW